MRTNKKIDIDETNTRQFFSERAKKYSAKNPYAVTMYQDENPDLVKQRNISEVKKILPILELSSDSQVLDIGCGIGRWADAIQEAHINISEYCGIDFSKELIEIARKRNANATYSFLVGGITDIDRIIKKKFNRIMMMGVSIYVNDTVLAEGLNQILNVCSDESKIVFREPIGIEDRLTLKDFYSDDLKTEYNAIYRTKDELLQLYEKTLIKDGFVLYDYGPMYKEELNNRKETTQWYFAFKR